MSIEALDRIRAAEREADEIVRNAHDEAKARIARAELDGRRYAAGGGEGPHEG